jgi:DAK2 domain fusion protein YloV
MTASIQMAVSNEKWFSCNGRQLRKMVKAGMVVLDQNHKLVNDLNVFPVPDGDTGTNMLLTMRAAYKRIEDLEEEHAGKVAQELSNGALMGARGNSGVILSQIWRGLARGLEEHASFDTDALALAFQDAADTAYKGVMQPVEGTILTVVREGAEEAQDAAKKSKDLRFLLERVVERCQQSLDRTPDLLPVLKQAGVVDAGGQGLVFILEGMLRYVQGEMPEVVELAEVAGVAAVPAQVKVLPVDGLEYPYDVQYILRGEGLDLMAVRTDIDAMGDSTVVVGDDQAIKVHVHVKDPGVPLSYGIKTGVILDVVVENMQEQMEVIVSGHAPTITSPAELGVADIEPGQIGVVAVTAGDGLAKIFQSLGAAGIVDGGQSNNPSTEEIFEVVQSVPTDNVIVLPNNKNIILAAEAARDLSAKNVVVVPTRTVPQGISALLSLDRDGDLQEIAEEMVASSTSVTSAEIAIATRDADLNGVSVEEGETIGVCEGRLCVSSTEFEEVLTHVLKEMDVANRELVSLYYGQEVSESEAKEMASKIEHFYPGIEVEVLCGNQAIYQFILGAE